MERYLAVALTKLADKEYGKLKLDPGEYSLDAEIRLRLSGGMRKGEDYLAKPTVAVPWKSVVALLIQRMGCQRDTAIQLLEEIMLVAMSNEQDKVAAIEEHTKELDAMTAKVSAMLASLPKIQKSGATTMQNARLEELELTYAR